MYLVLCTKSNKTEQVALNGMKEEEFSILRIPSPGGGWGNKTSQWTVEFFCMECMCGHRSTSDELQARVRRDREGWKFMSKIL